MSILDLKESEIGGLDSNQLVELVSLLAEAELAAHDVSSGYVYGSSENSAADGGVDLRIDIPEENFDTGFIRRPNTIYQIKSGTVTPSTIKKEMCPKGELRNSISEILKANGSYVIVNSKKCNDDMMKRRKEAMIGAAGDISKSCNFHIEFIHRRRLFEWTRKYPSICIWIKRTLGIDNSGWRPYENWSNPPLGCDNTMILDTGVSIFMPEKKDGLEITDAIDRLRELVQTSRRTVRIVGLSGVGKTRIIQSLFERTVGSSPALEKSIAIYLDVGANSDKDLLAMIKRLILENRKAIVILDNCSSEDHNILTSMILSKDKKNNISLITIEYDIEQDNPLDTNVVSIRNTGIGIATKLIQRRFSKINRIDANRIAHLANGNAKVALVLADSVRNGAGISELSDKNLFSRIFWQRNNPDSTVEEHAELLSLFFSFSVANRGKENDELAAIGTLGDTNRSSLMRSIRLMSRRGVVQQRSHLRAILPHAIANRLARSIFDDDIIIDDLRTLLEKVEYERLLVAFCHRLEQLRDHSISQKFATIWLSKSGLLGKPSTLGSSKLVAFTCISRIMPDLALKCIEDHIRSMSVRTPKEAELASSNRVMQVLEYMAREPETFENCIKLLIKVAKFNYTSSDYSRFVNSYFIKLYLPSESYNESSIVQRISFARSTILSESEVEQRIGSVMISSALGVPGILLQGVDHSTTPSRVNIVTERRSAIDTYSDSEEIIRWKSEFLLLVKDLTLSKSIRVSTYAISVMKGYIPEFWRQKDIQDTFIEIVKEIRQKRGFIFSLWREVRYVIFRHYAKHQEEDIPVKLSDGIFRLERITAPKNLHENIFAFLSCSIYDYTMLSCQVQDGTVLKRGYPERYISEIAENLGYEFAIQGQPFSSIKECIFGYDEAISQRQGISHLSYNFGQGLAKGSQRRRALWKRLVTGLNRFGFSNFNWKIFLGYIDEVAAVDRRSAQDFLDECVDHPFLSRRLIMLHSPRSFYERDFRRCMNALPEMIDNVTMIEELIPWLGQSNWASKFIVSWIEGILDTECNVTEILRQFDIHNSSLTKSEHWNIVLKVARRCLVQSFSMSGSSHAGEVDEYMSSIVDMALSRDHNELEKEKWIDAVFSCIDESYGDMNYFCTTVRYTASRLPDMFLERLFYYDDKIGNRRQDFVRHGIMSDPPLGKVDVDILIEWCKSNDYDEHWSVVAYGIDAWEIGEFGKYDTMTQNAIKFLESSSNPEDVLRSYIRIRNYTPGYGSLSDDLHLIIPEIQKLTRHRNSRISSAAEDSVNTIMRQIEQIEK